MISCIVFSALSVLLILGANQEYLPDLPIDHKAIQYVDKKVNDPVANLSKKITNGQILLEPHNSKLGRLGELLEYLNVKVDTQGLVFSKTSFQASVISPDNPRAIYFSDEVAVAFVRGSDLIEIAATDPIQGPIFYTADLREVNVEGFQRRKVCLQCHLGPATSGVPGLFVGSVFPGPLGNPSPHGAIITDHRTPFEDRWGGWYVNAVRGQQLDRSNAVASSPAEPLRLDQDQGQNLVHLYGKIDSRGYLASVSDIVALMTFEHQTQMQNFITRISWLERIRDSESDTTSSTFSRIDNEIDSLIFYMVFGNEVPLPEPLEGVSTFTETFPSRGPRDEKGRSLRDFDLQKRLFRYPLSYMVYSRSFDQLPFRVKAVIFRKLYDILTGETGSASFDHLGEKDRHDIFSILLQTKPDLPDYWH